MISSMRNIYIFESGSDYKPYSLLSPDRYKLPLILSVLGLRTDSCLDEGSLNF